LGQTPKHFGGLGVQKPSNIHLQPLPPLDPGQYLTSLPTLPPAHYVTTNSPENLQNLEYNNGIHILHMVELNTCIIIIIKAGIV
jgi:hypothetical protein